MPELTLQTASLYGVPVDQCMLTATTLTAIQGHGVLVHLIDSKTPPPSLPGYPSNIGTQLGLMNWGRVLTATLHVFGKHTGTQVLIEMLTGKTITIGWDLRDTVDDMIDRIHCKEGIPPDLQRLIYAGIHILPGTLPKPSEVSRLNQ